MLIVYSQCIHYRIMSTASVIVCCSLYSYCSVSIVSSIEFPVLCQLHLLLRYDQCIHCCIVSTSLFIKFCPLYPLLYCDHSIFCWIVSIVSSIGFPLCCVHSIFCWDVPIAFTTVLCPLHSLLSFVHCIPYCNVTIVSSVGLWSLSYIIFITTSP